MLNVDRLIERIDHVRIRGIDVIAADVAIAVRVAHIDIDEAVGCKIWVECEPEQTALSRCIDLAGKVEKRRRKNLP